MRRSVWALSALMLLASVQGGPLAEAEAKTEAEAKKPEAKNPEAKSGAKSEASKASRMARKRVQIDRNAREALDQLFSKNDKAKRHYERSVGYAAFQNTKVSLGVTGGGGVGVAVDKETGKRTYMKMGTAGLNLGAGAQVFQVVFLFEDQETFDKFVNKGWDAGASANAVAGPAGANAEATFIKGMAVYQLTRGGLMLQADISGTKYWKHKNLN